MSLTSVATSSASITAMMLLQDELTLNLALENNAKQFQEGRARVYLPTFFQAAVNSELPLELITMLQAHESATPSLTMYTYKSEYIFVLLSQKPTEAEQVYQEALRINTLINSGQRSGVFLFLNDQICHASRETSKALVYRLFDDASKAGHMNARNELIEATIRGNAEARKYVTFDNYNLEFPTLLLPRKFKTAEDFHLLGTTLIVDSKNYLEGMPLRGHFYILKNGSVAERLGRNLQALAVKLRNAEEGFKRTRHYAANQEEKNTIESTNEIQEEKLSLANASQALFTPVRQKTPQTLLEENHIARSGLRF